MDGASWLAIVVGVGSNPNAVSDVRGANVGRRYAVPFRIKPERGQVSEYCFQPPIKQRSDVFHDDEARSKFANKTAVLGPKARFDAPNAFLGTSIADVLAREPAADDIDGNSVSGKSIGCESSNVFIAWHPRPVFCQDTPAVRFNFTESDGLESARAFET
jgi:hypothetical protein